MISKNARFKWTETMQKAFHELKEKLNSPPVLTFPEFENTFFVETDSSAAAVGATLSQQKEAEKVHPIHLACRTMNNAEMNQSACEREARAVIFALKKFCVYILAAESFQLTMDHQALQ